MISNTAVTVLQSLSVHRNLVTVTKSMIHWRWMGQSCQICVKLSSARIKSPNFWQRRRWRFLLCQVGAVLKILNFRLRQSKSLSLIDLKSLSWQKLFARWTSESPFWTSDPEDRPKSWSCFSKAFKAPISLSRDAGSTLAQDWVFLIYESATELLHWTRYPFKFVKFEKLKLKSFCGVKIIN